MVFKRLPVVLLCLGLVPAGVRAATPEETQSQLQTVQQTLAQSNAKVSDITAALAAALKAQSDISERLVALGGKIREQQAAAAESDARLRQLEGQSVTLASDLAAKSDELSSLLAGLQRLQQNPPPALVVEPGNVLEALRGAMMFGAVVPDFSAKAKDLKARLDELQAIRDATVDERQRQAEAMQALNASQDELQNLQRQKKAFAEAAQQNLAAEKANAAALADKAKSLQQLLADLQKAREAEEQRKSAEAKAAADAAAKAEAERQAALQRSLAPLSTQKGKLTYPVAGSLIKSFGDDTGLGTKLDGLAIATPANAAVTAPVDGKVEFAGNFRSYGQLLILNAGEGYLVLLAGMKQISAEMGQVVRMGEPVGVMGDGPSTLTLLGDETDHSHPIFYVEFRRDNAPVDSTPWWAAGRKEAMK
ncbi:MAG: peptidoglycan DD-metalloendopeptidase family protein [Alphaproteobacteria bacterium]|nr:peptidoglycan DD-metalloendopeptidase family protein [Alphaproteobacteria bacterium]